MMNAQWHLAQLNVGRLVAPLGSTALAASSPEEHPRDPVVDAEFCWPELAAS